MATRVAPVLRMEPGLEPVLEPVLEQTTGARHSWHTERGQATAVAGPAGRMEPVQGTADEGPAVQTVPAQATAVAGPAERMGPVDERHPGQAKPDDRDERTVPVACHLAAARRALATLVAVLERTAGAATRVLVRAAHKVPTAVAVGAAADCHTHSGATEDGAPAGYTEGGARHIGRQEVVVPRVLQVLLAVELRHRRHAGVVVLADPSTGQSADGEAVDTDRAGGLVPDIPA